MGPETLSQVLRHVTRLEDENLLVGLETSDDAAVYKLSEDIAIIQTLDFFTPIVDSPFLFGQIAAANALSDVYAMGGRPITAMNIVGFPNCLKISILGEILKGGAQKVAEAGAVLAGGHTVQDDEPKYGLAVAGVVHPREIVTNSAARPGDYLVLTKAIGIGILSTALKGGLLEEGEDHPGIQLMACLNDYAGEVIRNLKIKAATDITGFGLLGHAWEMAEGSRAGMEIWFEEIPVIEDVTEHASMGLIPEGCYRNRGHFLDHVRGEIDDELLDLLFDPQTSGGLLISCPPAKLDQLMQQLEDKAPDNIYCEPKVIGRVTRGDRIIVRKKRS